VDPSRRVKHWSWRVIASALLLSSGLALAQGAKDDEATPKARPAREPGAKVETVTIRKKNLSIALPKDWVLVEKSDPSAALSLEVLLPGSEVPAALVLFAEHGDPRPMPYAQAKGIREHYRDAKVEFEVRTKPWPQLVATEPGGSVDWFLYRSIRNHLFTLRFRCAAGDFAGSEEDTLSAMKSFTADVELWPPIPKGYKTSPHGTWLVATAPGVTASTAPILKVLRAQEQRFIRDHGALPKSDIPIVVLVHNAASDAEKIEPGAGESGAFHLSKRRIFAVPFGPKSKEEAAQLAEITQATLFLVRYGDTEPDWIWKGEGTLARAEEIRQEPLPGLFAGFRPSTSDLTLHRISELPGLRESDYSTWADESFFYVASLHRGSHKEAYAKFLEDYLETGDAQGAYARQLAPVGEDALRAAAIEYMSLLVESGLFKRGG